MTRHCWKCSTEDACERFGVGSQEHIDALDEPGTCFLEDGHDGPHEFTPDQNIVIEFPPADAPKP